MKRVTVLALAVVAVTIATWGLVSAQGATPSLVIGHQSVEIGSTIGIPVALQALPNGLSGFSMEIQVSSSTVASIEGVVFDLQPDLLIAFKDLDETAFTLGVADLGDHWQAGSSFSELFDVKLQGNSPGQGLLTVTPLQVDDDDGSPIPAAPASLLVVVP